MAVSAISVWMCEWIGECGKNCKALWLVIRLKKRYINASQFIISPDLTLPQFQGLVFRLQWRLFRSGVSWQPLLLLLCCGWRLTSDFLLLPWFVDEPPGAELHPGAAVLLPVPGLIDDPAVPGFQLVVQPTPASCSLSVIRLRSHCMRWSNLKERVDYLNLDWTLWILLVAHL